MLGFALLTPTYGPTLIRPAEADPIPMSSELSLAPFRPLFVFRYLLMVIGPQARRMAEDSVPIALLCHTPSPTPGLHPEDHP